MSTRSLIAQTLLVPCLAFVTAALLAWQVFEEGRNAALLAVPIGLWILAAVGKALGRERRLKPLLRQQHAPMSSVSIVEFGVYEEDYKHLPGGAAHRDKLVRMLGLRRLVILTGPRLSGRSSRAYVALRHGFSSFHLLRPVLPGAESSPPLTELLTTAVLRPGGRYALWLEDLAGLLQAGFDPRVVERWLASGRGRIAIARITPTELNRFQATGSPAAISLGRAIQVRVKALPHHAPDGSPEDRYSTLLSSGAPAAQAIRVTALLELLGVLERSPAILNRVLECLGGEQLSPEAILDLCGGHDALISIDQEGVVSVHPALLAVVDEEHEAVERDVQEALMVTLDARGLIAASQALAIRRQHEDAARMLEAARDRTDPGPDLDSAIATATIRLLELSEGPSGVTFANTGGFDFREPMGWAQIKRLKTRKGNDEIFDLNAPPAEDSFSSRFYRLTLYRAGARVVVLAFLDCVALMIASAAALSARSLAQDGTVGGPSVRELPRLLVPAIAVTIPVAIWVGLYRANRARAEIQLILATMTITTVTVAVVYFTKNAQVGALAAILTMYATAFAADSLLRYGYDVVSRKWVIDRHLQPRVLILGSEKEARACAKSLAAPGGRPVTVVAYLPKAADGSPNRVYGALEKRLIDLHITEVVIADRALDLNRKADLIDRIQTLGADVRYVANEKEVILGASGRIGDHGLVLVPAALISPESRELKHALDWAIVVATLPLWGFVLLAYAAYSMVRRSGQPVFVRTGRVGLGNVGFSMLRLRTRTLHEPSKLRGANPTGRVEAIVERLGIDELPQVFNVLRGEMSIVGWRPLHDQDVEHLTLEQRRTLGTRPGMTGRWQVEWGPDASTPEIRALDADYTRHWRISRDLDLMVRTPLVVARRRLYLGDTEIRKRMRTAERLH